MKQGLYGFNGEKFRKNRQLLSMTAGDVVLAMKREIGLVTTPNTIYGWELGKRPQTQYRKWIKVYSKRLAEIVESKKVPAFFESKPKSKVKTYLVTYEDGSQKVMSGVRKVDEIEYVNN